jgi:hypothetical protein
VKLLDQEQYPDSLHERIAIRRASEHGDPIAGKGPYRVSDPGQHHYRLVEGPVVVEQLPRSDPAHEEVAFEREVQDDQIGRLPEWTAVPAGAGTVEVRSLGTGAREHLEPRLTHPGDEQLAEPVFGLNDEDLNGSIPSMTASR